MQAWDNLPLVDITIDSMTVRDTTAAAPDDLLLNVPQLRAQFDIGRLLDDTLGIRFLELRGAKLNFVSDSSGRFNVGRLFAPRDTSETKKDKGGGGISLDYVDANIRVSGTEVYYSYPPKHKLYHTCFNDLDVRARRPAPGEFTFDGQLDAFVEGLFFNTTKGAYLRTTPVSGPVNFRMAPAAFSVDKTTMRIGEQDITLSIKAPKNGVDTLWIRAEADSLYYDPTLAILHDELQVKMRKYQIDGVFPVAADIGMAPGERYPTLIVDFTLDRQPVRINKYQFQNVSTDVHLVNWLPVAAGGTPGGRADFRIQFDTCHAWWSGIDIYTPGGRLDVADNDPILVAPVVCTGSARTVSNLLKNDQFLFERGRFRADLDVDVSLLDQTEIARQTDVRLRMDDVRVHYVDAGARLEFEEIGLVKRGDDVRFDVRSATLPGADMAFRLRGELDNFAPLVLNVPGGTVRSRVTLSSDRLDWGSFLGLFSGDGAYADLGGGGGAAAGAKQVEREQGGSSATSAGALAGGSAAKATLRGLQREFHPDLDIVIDTVTYYDLFTLTKFKTGVHLEADSLFLDRTSFDWRDSEVAFGARLDISRPDTTPFDVRLRTERLDLNGLRPSFNHFGFTLPESVTELPSELNVDFEHRGLIEDSTGLIPNYNAGRLAFNDGGAERFRGKLRYTPTAAGLESHLDLSGDPALINDLVRAENFLFGSGHFALQMDVLDFPESAADLLASSTIELTIDTTQMDYPAGGVYLPIRHFDVRVAEDRADYHLRLNTEISRRDLFMEGYLDGLSAFLAPDSTLAPVFRVGTSVRAQTLTLDDLTDILRNSPNAVKNDTAKMDTRRVFSATGGVFNTFRPDLELSIDTFWVGRAIPLRGVHAGLFVEDSTRLRLERSGFTFGEGEVQLAATYDLDTLAQSPFKAQWRVEDMDLDRFFNELKQAGVYDSLKLGDMGGRITLGGDLNGYLNETDQQILIDSLRGGVLIDLNQLDVLRNPDLMAAGKKFWMGKRMREIRFAPVYAQINVDSNQLLIPQTEIHGTAFQLFVEGKYDLSTGPDLLVSIPLRNLFFGNRHERPERTGYDDAGWKVHLVLEPKADGTTAKRFRLGRRKYYRERGRLEEFKAMKRARRKRK